MKATRMVDRVLGRGRRPPLLLILVLGSALLAPLASCGSSGASPPTSSNIYLGIEIMTITPQVQQQYGLLHDEGVLVIGVQSDSPAARAGLKTNDVITAVDGTTVTSQSELDSILQRKGPGAQVQLTVYSDGRESTVSVTLRAPAPG